MRDDAIRIGKRFIGEFQRDDIAGLSAELAYRFLFALFPFGIFVAALTAFLAHALGFANPTSEIMGSIGDNLPREIADVVRPQLEAVLGDTAPGLLTFGAVAALWAATGGLNALMKALNRAWEVDETRSFLPKTALAIGLTLLGSVGLVGSFVTIVGASLLTTEVAARLGLDGTVAGIVGLLRWPVVFAMLSLAVAVLYRYAPNFRAPWRWCVAGGALFAVTWIVATVLFGLYVANFANYANTYGALGGVIVLMLWFYLSGILLVAAAALAAAALKETRPAAVHEERVARGAVRGSATGDAVGAGVAPETEATSRVGATPTGDDPREARPIRPPRRRTVPAHRMSGPDDWAAAGLVTMAGASLGVLAAWALRDRRGA